MLHKTINTLVRYIFSLISSYYRNTKVDIIMLNMDTVFMKQNPSWFVLFFPFQSATVFRFYSLSNWVS